MKTKSIGSDVPFKQVLTLFRIALCLGFILQASQDAPGLNLGLVCLIGLFVVIISGV